MLLEELRRMANKFKSKEEAKRKKLIKKYEVKISNELRKKVLSTGKIYLNTIIPVSIYKDIVNIFESKGFEILNLGLFGDDKINLIIKDSKEER